MHLAQGRFCVYSVLVGVTYGKRIKTVTTHPVMHKFRLPTTVRGYHSFMADGNLQCTAEAAFVVLTGRQAGVCYR